MERFDWLREVFESTVGLVAGSLTILLFLDEVLGLTTGNTLRVGILVGLGGVQLGISALESDLEDAIGELDAEIIQGFNKVTGLIQRQQEGTEVRTDGAGEAVFVPDLRTDGPSGNGAAGGMLAGGALGIPFGTVGAVIGGVLGGLIGNEIEYRDLKDREREKLTRAANRYLHYRTDVDPRDLELVDVTGPGTTGSWRFRYRERSSGRKHLLELDPEARAWSYEVDDSRSVRAEID